MIKVNYFLRLFNYFLTAVSANYVFIQPATGGLYKTPTLIFLPFGLQISINNDSPMLLLSRHKSDLFLNCSANDTITGKFLDNLYSNAFIPMITCPTRITAHIQLH